MPRRSVAKVKEGSTAVVAWDAELAKYAQAAAEQEQSALGGAWLSLKSGVLSWGGNPMEGNQAEAVVLASCIENAFYEEEFDADNPSSPACFAFGSDEKAMAPHAESPHPQHGDCATCDRNKFGTALTGNRKGKACKNIRRLALVPADCLKSAEAVGKADVAFLKLPVTSVRPWAQYVTKLANILKVPPFAVVTRIRVLPDAKNQFSVVFDTVSQVSKAVGPALLARVREAEEALRLPYQPFERDEAPRGGAARKPAAKRPAAKRPAAGKPAAKRPAAGKPPGKAGLKF